MTGQNKLETIFKIAGSSWRVEPGPLMSELKSAETSSPGTTLRAVLQQGRKAALELLDDAGVRGRAGGGFPTGHKWWLVSSAEAGEKFFICNANLAEPGRSKEGWLLLANPIKVIEAVAIAAYCVNAHCAYIAIPENARDEVAAVENSLRAAYDSGMLGASVLGSGYQLDVKLVKTPSVHLSGEETALMEFIEGKAVQPRRKPPLPTSAGLFGKPTAVNNLETVLQCRYALKSGAASYRSAGADQSPGTMIFTLRGCIERPGIYELPLGTSLRELIFTYGGGAHSHTALKGIFPGGVGSAVLTGAHLDTPLDFDSVRDAGSELGSGNVIVFGEDTCAVELSVHLAEFFHEASCGKCRPCKDGTGRAYTLLSKIDQLEQPGLDVSERMLPPSKRPPQSQFTIINNLARGISYTDSSKGIDKISNLCEFFRYRGDCHHSTEAAGALISLIQTFPEEFSQHMRHGACKAPEFEHAPGSAMFAAR